MNIQHRTSNKKTNTEKRIQNDKKDEENAVTVFDGAGVMERLDGDKNILQKICNSFLAYIPAQIQVLKENLEEEKMETLERQAHTIKDASADVGGTLLCEIADIMEKAGKAGNMTAIKETLPELENEFDRLKTAMDKFIGSANHS